MWPFDLRFMQLALAAGLVVGVAAPLIGSFMVQKRLSLLGDGIGHIAFAGVALGLLLEVWPVWSALAVSIVAALAIEWLRRSGRVSGDLALAVFFYGGIAAGVVLAGAAGSLDASLLSFLFGQILTVTPAEVLVIAGLGVAIIAGVAFAGRALFAVVVDEESARAAGLPVDALNAFLAVMIAVTVVIAMRAVGVLLVAALMVLPVGTAQAVARSFKASLALSAAIGAGCVVLGLSASRAWGLEPGGMIVLIAAALFVLVSAIGAGRRAPWSPPRNPVKAPSDR